MGFIARHQLWTSSQEQRGRELMALMESGAVRWVRLVFPDAHGILRGKTLSANAARHALESGHGVPSSLLLKDTSGRTVYPVFGRPEGLQWPQFRGIADLVMVPDPETWRILPWAGDTGWLLADVYFTDGTAVPFAPRAKLREQLGRFAGRNLGYRVGIELEFYVFPEVEGETVAGPSSRGRAAKRHLQLLWEDRLDQLDVVIRALQEGLEKIGIPLRTMETELGPGQLEITLEPASGLDAADSLVLLRSAIRQICRRLGYRATFMCRPQGEDLPASGWHIHQSVYDLDSGRNRFAPETGHSHLLSPLGEAFLGGILAHGRAMTAFAVPTVNGYKRLNPYSLAPDRVAWAVDNRAAMVRVAGSSDPDSVHLENRVAEPAANPYLVLAAQLAAGWDGITRQLDPGEAADAPYESQCPRLPRTLAEALTALEEDRELTTLLGEDLVRWFTAIKEAEWNRFLGTVTDWEQGEYLDLF